MDVISQGAHLNVIARVQYHLDMAQAELLKSRELLNTHWSNELKGEVAKVVGFCKFVDKAEVEVFQAENKGA